MMQSLQQSFSSPLTTSARSTAAALLLALSIAAGGAFALPSGGLGGLQQTGATMGDFQKGYAGLQKGTIDKMDRSNQLQLDENVPKYQQQYGEEDQGDVQANNPRQITTQPPPPQSQKEVTPRSVDRQTPLATELSYKNMGGKNIAIPGPPAGPQWYHLPMDNTNISARGEFSHSGFSKAAFTMFPVWNRSGLETSSQHQVTSMLGAVMQAQLTNSPQAQMHKASANSQAAQQGASDASADAAENALDTSITCFRQSLINVANENAATPTSAQAPTKLISEAVWMVQKMYKQVYLPMAILLLLPGALMTNLKGVISFGILHNANDEDAVSPFSGILRSLVAIFLIPATQLIVSWATDIGNSMTYEVQQRIVPATIVQWAQEQTFNAPLKNSVNHLKLPQMSDKAGKITETLEKTSKVEQQGAATRMLQMAFNFVNMALGFGMTILLAFQVVMMCYLLLMGPIAAAFFAWPSSCGSLFKNVFANWVDAVTNLALWRFWWCIVILCMQTRIEWLAESGNYQPNTTWEMAIFTSFMFLLTYVPFLPFDYKPGEMAAKLLEKVSEAQKGGGGGGGGSGGGHGASAGAAAGHTASASHSASASPSHSSPPSASPSSPPSGRPESSSPPRATPTFNGVPRENLLYHGEPPREPTFRNV